MKNIDDFISINLHLTKRCNMRCRTCFAHYEGDSELGESGWLDCLEIIDRESRHCSRRKINFVGGEPTILPFLGTLIANANERGFVTGLVTNGHTIDEAFLHSNAGLLDILGISVDSLNKQTNQRLRRSINRIAWTGTEYLKLMNRIKEAGYCLKINTVVSVLNHQEDFCTFIADAAPERWKVFQCLVIKGQNDSAASLVVSDADFKSFNQRHAGCRNKVEETAESMKGSYIMVDPLGRPYGNANGVAVYGNPMLQAGFMDQLATLGYSREKAVNRDADYF